LVHVRDDGYMAGLHIGENLVARAIRELSNFPFIQAINITR